MAWVNQFYGVLSVFTKRNARLREENAQLISSAQGSNEKRSSGVDDDGDAGVALDTRNKRAKKR